MGRRKGRRQKRNADKDTKLRYGAIEMKITKDWLKEHSEFNRIDREAADKMKQASPQAH